MNPAIAMLVAVAGAPAHAAPADYVVVINARNPTASIGVDELKKIFLGQTAFWHGVVPMTVIMRPPGSDVGGGFLADVLQTSAQKYERTWASKQLSGQGIAPTNAASTEELVQGVASRPGAIGFLLASEAWSLPDTVKSIPIAE